jgi:hypothetical protein
MFEHGLVDLSYDIVVNSKHSLSLTFMIIVASTYSVVMVFYCAEVW